MAFRLLVTSLVLVAGAAGMGVADDAAADLERAKARAEQKRAAAAVEKAALESKDPATYVACGEAYLAIYNSDREHPHNDEVLYNAGVCFEEARSIGSALQTYALVKRYYPNSKLAMKALARSAMLYADTAYFERAAEQLEEYAMKYAGEKDAMIALGEAIYYYRALGDPKWIQLTRIFIKQFAAKRPEEAAQAHFALSSAYERDPEAQIKHLRDFIRTYGNRDPGRLTLAHAKLGDLAWAKACAVKTTNGLCVKQVRVKAGKRCGQGVLVEDVAVVRDEQHAKEAMLAYLAALKLHERAPGKADPAVTYAAATAELTLADRELERMLALPLPKALELGASDEAQRARSEKRFAVWLEMQRKTGAAAIARYEAVIARRDAVASIAALQRIAQTSELLWKQLDAAEVPKGQGEAYCSALRDVAEPLHQRARDAYLTCAAKAAELLLYTPASEACLRALERLEPAQFPPPRERVAPALAAGTVLAVEPPITHAPW
jgi:hypothetical protein